MVLPCAGRVFLALMLALAVAPVVAVPQIQYLYINAGEGTSSGGHVALKINDEVFHFQYVAPGLLRIKRDDYAQFRELYADKENRTIQTHTIDVSPETLEILREHFNRIRLIQDEQFDRYEALENDRKLLKALLQMTVGTDRHDHGANRMELSGLGLFIADEWDYPDAYPSHSVQPVDATLARLSDRAGALYGDGFLSAKTREILHQLKTLKPNEYALNADVLLQDRFRPADYSFSRRYVDSLGNLAALRVLALGLPLREGSLMQANGAESRLSEPERLGLMEFKARLESRLLDSLNSNRPDWGLAFLVGMARLIAVDCTLNTGHWVFLNRLERPATEPVDGPQENQGAAYAVIRARFLAAKEALASDPSSDEWAYTQLEQAANIFSEFGNALREGRLAHVDSMSHLPAYRAKMALIPPAIETNQLRAYLKNLENYRKDYGTGLTHLYSYNLIGRNCASEIFRVIGQAMREASSLNACHGVQSEAADVAESESTRRLGGYVSGQGLEFIPFLSFHIVGETWRVSSTEITPSYRLRSVEKAKAFGNPYWVGLRESTVFSSSLYRWHGGDSAFVFFTDDLLLTRPLAGGVNFVAGVVKVAVGLATLPWDSGESFKQGAKGILNSLPELFFFNIRKGSFPGLVELGG